MPKIGLISDTHGRLYPHVFDLLEGVELILHAGDVCSDTILVDLEAIAPVEAVPGNCDGPPLTQRVPLRRVFDLPVGKVGLTHGHCVPVGHDWPLNLPGYFADPNLTEPASDLRFIVYGHSHVARCEKLATPSGGEVTIINPGSAGAPRFGARPTLALLHYDEPEGSEPRIEFLTVQAD